MLVKTRAVTKRYQRWHVPTNSTWTVDYLQQGMKAPKYERIIKRLETEMEVFLKTAPGFYKHVMQLTTAMRLERNDRVPVCVGLCMDAGARILRRDNTAAAVLMTAALAMLDESASKIMRQAWFRIFCPAGAEEGVGVGFDKMAQSSLAKGAKSKTVLAFLEGKPPIRLPDELPDSIKAQVAGLMSKLTLSTLPPGVHTFAIKDGSVALMSLPDGDPASN